MGSNFMVDSALRHGVRAATPTIGDTSHRARTNQAGDRAGISYRPATVVNSLSGQPVPAVRVAIARTTQGTERDINQAITTGPDGRFSFTGLSRGKYSLMATARGFSLQYFDHHDPYATAIAVGPDLDSGNLVFRIEPDAAIDGTVTDDNNEPIQYAMVRLFQRSTEEGMQKTEPMNQSQTDDQGHYHIGHLEPGTYYLAVSARPWYAQNAGSVKTLNSDAQQRSTDESALDVTYPLTFYPPGAGFSRGHPTAIDSRRTRDRPMSRCNAVQSSHLRIHTGAADSPVIGRMIFPRIWQRTFEGYLDSVSNAPRLLDLARRNRDFGTGAGTLCRRDSRFHGGEREGRNTRLVSRHRSFRRRRYQRLRLAWLCDHQRDCSVSSPRSTACLYPAVEPGDRRDLSQRHQPAR